MGPGRGKAKRVFGDVQREMVKNEHEAEIVPLTRKRVADFAKQPAGVAEKT
jgi:hypothetical protein